MDCVLDNGYKHLTLVDVSEAALQLARERLGDRATSVTWCVADARYLQLPEKVDVWHDRAVFHFLTTDTDREAYLSSLRAALRVGGHIVIATFGPTGPERCSGLEVKRYAADTLADFFGSDFALLQSVEKQHMTPSGGTQQFTYAVFRRLR